MHERFVSFSLPQLQMLVEMQCEHLHLYYAAESTTEVGSEIRDRMFSALLSLLYAPVYDRLGKQVFGFILFLVILVPMSNLLSFHFYFLVGDL